MKTLSNRYLATLLLSMTARAAVADRLVDPTQPPQPRAISNGQPISAVRVEAIMQSGGSRVAIVNGKVVRAGDRIGAMQILEVNADSVRYSRAGETNIARIEQKSMQVRRNVVQPEEES